MSASLVGSEMCIRDRQRSPLLRPRPRRARPQPQPPGPPPPRSCCPPKLSVSYTHLTLPTICSV
eukprot:14053291-Alexandrium_andersonii.AAC.1